VSDAQGPGDGGPGTQTPPPPRRPPQSPPPALPPTAAERGGMRALFLSIAGLLWSVFLPIFGLLGLVGLVPLIAGVVMGIRAKRRSRLILARAPGATAAIVVGIISLFLVTPSLVIRVIVAPELEGLSKCLSSALTITDKQACKDRYFPKIEHKLHISRGSLNRYSNMF
jgi:uncharacterized protein YybS (DUF2232 family)